MIQPKQWEVNSHNCLMNSAQIFPELYYAAKYLIRQSSSLEPLRHYESSQYSIRWLWIYRYEHLSISTKWGSSSSMHTALESLILTNKPLDRRYEAYISFPPGYKAHHTIPHNQRYLRLLKQGLKQELSTKASRCVPFYEAACCT